jgi:hypothetical protein
MPDTRNSLVQRIPATGANIQPKSARENAFFVLIFDNLRNDGVV